MGKSGDAAFCQRSLTTCYHYWHAVKVWPCRMSRATGRPLTFMTADDVVLARRRRQSTRQVQTTLKFYYKTDCELCLAVRALSRKRHRVRRQAEFDNSQRVVTHEVSFHTSGGVWQQSTCRYPRSRQRRSHRNGVRKNRPQWQWFICSNDKIATIAIKHKTFELDKPGRIAALVDAHKGKKTHYS